MGVAQRHVVAQLVGKGVIAAADAGHAVAIGGGVGIEATGILVAAGLVADTADVAGAAALRVLINATRSAPYC